MAGERQLIGLGGHCAPVSGNVGQDASVLGMGARQQKTEVFADEKSESTSYLGVAIHREAQQARSIDF